MFNSLLDDPKRPGRITKAEAQAWNAFRESQPDLKDERDLTVLYGRYKKANPKGSISETAIKNEFGKLDSALKAESVYNFHPQGHDASSRFYFPPMLDAKGMQYGLMTGDYQPSFPQNGPDGRPLRRPDEVPDDTEWQYNPQAHSFKARMADGDWAYVHPSVVNNERFRGYFEQWMKDKMADNPAYGK